MRWLFPPRCAWPSGPLEANWHDAENYVKPNLALMHGHRADAPGEELFHPSECEPELPPAPQSTAKTSPLELSPGAVVEGRWREVEEALRTTVQRADLFTPEHIGRMD